MNTMKTFKQCLLAGLIAASFTLSMGQRASAIAPDQGHRRAVVSSVVERPVTPANALDKDGQETHG